MFFQAHGRQRSVLNSVLRIADELIAPKVFLQGVNT